MREFSGQAPNVEIHPLKPHHYPVWIIGFAVVVVATCAYAAQSLPQNFVTAKLFADASAIDAKGNHAAAEAKFRDVLARAPHARKVRLALAKAMFADDDPGNDVEALKLLVDLKLSKSEWEDIRLFMPEKYRRLFVEEKS